MRGVGSKLILRGQEGLQWHLMFAQYLPKNELLCIHKMST